MIGADWGAGHVQNLQLVNALGEQNVAQLWHTGMGGGAGGGGGGSKGQARAKFEGKTRKWHLNRRAVLTDTFESLRKGQIRLPRQKENEILFQHLMAESMEFRDISNRLFYTHVAPDDGLHALTYATLAGELLTRGNFGGHQGQIPQVQPASNRPDREYDYNEDDANNMY